MVYLQLIWMGLGLIVAAGGVVFAFEGPARAAHDGRTHSASTRYWNMGKPR